MWAPNRLFLVFSVPTASGPGEGRMWILVEREWHFQSAEGGPRGVMNNRGHSGGGEGRMWIIVERDSHFQSREVW